jgi:branched-chain amino acid transport system ATP-binding protein
LSGLAVLIVEQSVRQMLRVADRAYLLEAVALCASGTADLLASEQIREAYLGA